MFVSVGTVEVAVIVLNDALEEVYLFVVVEIEYTNLCTVLGARDVEAYVRD
jgi:hypothetical protein